ncbi:uncharacterized protein LOC141595900 [Silene latifolia]|uniref:uncharacterized protein LOC141595900 n=1 Tax=Silene latifolia TaxID=37657 RepID=UPI003D77196C
MMMMMNSSLIKTQPSYHISAIQTNLHKSPLFIPYRPRNLNPTTFAKLEYHEHADAGVKSQSSSTQLVVKNDKGMGMGRRLLVTGGASIGFVAILMGLGHDKAWALGPEGPLMEEFWENVRRYGLYALTVSTGVLYSVFQPIYELLKNPISAILVLVIIGGTFYIGSQVLSAMVGLSDFDYQYAY